MRREWTDGGCLSDYRVGDIVEKVPIAHREFDGAWQYGQRCKRRNIGGTWQADLRQIVEHYDETLDGPSYFCKRCNRIEDGTHRMLARCERGVETVDIEIGGLCHEMSRRCPDDDALLKVVLASLQEVRQGNRDSDWANACKAQKWPAIDEHVDFCAKSFLDIGCQSGFSTFAAYRRGAYPVFGVDVREEMLKACRITKGRLKARISEVEFERLSIEDEFRPYDIVSCMGLLHYFNPEKYESLLSSIAGICRETLILEVRVSQQDAGMEIRGGQTLCTEQWLFQQLSERGFVTRSSVVNQKENESRQVWIAKRSLKENGIEP